MRYQFTISHIPGKDLVIADTLSRAPVCDSDHCSSLLEQEVDAYVRLVIGSLPATEKHLEDIRSHQERDEVCRQLISFCLNGWPEKSQLKGPVKKFHAVSSQLSVEDGLLMRGSRIVIPSYLRQDMLHLIHEGHQGIVKCRERARHSVWWPGLSTQLEDLVYNCPVCVKERVQRPEPLSPTKFPSRPWQKLGTDLFDWKGSKYLLVVDYFSRFVEISKLSGETCGEVVRHMKSIFARHGVPEELMSDNGPQFAASEFSEFAMDYGFHHQTSSPHFPQSNGEAERAVQTIKHLLQKAEDPYKALLVYRSTPLHNGYSPAELLMSRRLRTTLPVIPSKLRPSLPDFHLVRKKEEQARERQMNNFDTRHRAASLEPLLPGDNVWVTDRRSSGMVVEQSAPRSYQVVTPSREFRRNRRHLNVLPPSPSEAASAPQETVPPSPSQSSTSSGQSTESNVSQPVQESSDPPGVVRTRSGRVSIPRVPYDPSWK